MEDIIILDTNAWIYMCNAHPFQKDENGRYPHIKMFNSLVDLVENKNVVILTNDLILAEWDRNKAAARNYIKRLEGAKGEKENRLKKKEVRSNLEESEKIRSEIRVIESLIDENEKHILNVEQFLKDKTTKYPITDTSKIIAANQAIAKKAPFTGKKSNSMADMVILLSGIEYIKNTYGIEIWKDEIIYPTSYFVSGNKTDFSNKENESIIHEDIAPFLESITMEYYINLGEFINQLSDTNILTDSDIQDYNNFVYGDVEPCPLCDDDLDAYIYFTKKIQVRDESKPLYNDDQLRFSFIKETTDELNEQAYIETYEGSCSWCGTRYMQCCVCGEMLEVDDEFECDECGSIYRTTVAYREKDIIYDLNYFLLAPQDTEDDIEKE